MRVPGGWRKCDVHIAVIKLYLIERKGEYEESMFSANAITLKVFDQRGCLLSNLAGERARPKLFIISKGRDILRMYNIDEVTLRI